MAGKGEIWVVQFDADAVVDMEGVKSKGDRKAVFKIIVMLMETGPRLRSPHVKSLKGEPDLFELRPKQGAIAVRPIFARVGDRFVILAVAATKPEFGRALRDARTRLIRYR